MWFCAINKKKLKKKARFLLIQNEVWEQQKRAILESLESCLVYIYVYTYTVMRNGRGTTVLRGKLGVFLSCFPGPKKKSWVGGREEVFSSNLSDPSGWITGFILLSFECRKNDEFPAFLCLSLVVQAITTLCVKPLAHFCFLPLEIRRLSESTNCLGVGEKSPLQPHLPIATLHPEAVQPLPWCHCVQVWGLQMQSATRSITLVWCQRGYMEGPFSWGKWGCLRKSPGSQCTGTQLASVMSR